MIAGPNGSGKSTLTAALQQFGVEFGEYINADEIDRTLDGPPGTDRSQRAQRIADERRAACLADRRSFTFETVMSHPSKVELLHAARRAGYRVVIFFVALENPTLNVQRVRQRVALGGHPVPEDRIVARYARCLDLLPMAIQACDRAVLFDNSYRDRADERVSMTPFCEILRGTGKSLRSFRFRSADGADLSVMDPKIPLWSRPLLRRVLPGAAEAWGRGARGKRD